MLKKILITLGAIAALLVALVAMAFPFRWELASWMLESNALDEAFVGVTVDGQVQEGLFVIEATGTSPAALVIAAEQYLDALSEEQRNRVQFPVDDPEWRKWMNPHFYIRQGVSFLEMDDAQRNAGYGLMQAALSDDGYQLARDIMRLDTTLAELNDNNFEEYGEDRFWITMMGEPSNSEPWGWQLDGHHLIINHFVMGGQAVMSPLFLGAEPVIARSGVHEGVAILQEHQDAGLAMLRSLTAEQQAQAILATDKPGNNNMAEFFQDNAVVPLEGISAQNLTREQQLQLLHLAGLFIHTMNAPQAGTKMQEVAAHLEDTHFAWVGGDDDNSVFYFRIQSPVVMIEFDHQRPVGLSHLTDSDAPQRDHIHAVIRTPNGNDYGKDLLRQHFERAHTRS